MEHSGKQNPKIGFKSPPRAEMPTFKWLFLNNLHSTTGMPFPASLFREVLQLCRSALISWADMVLASSVAGLFKWRQFEPEVILLAVGWYLRFSLSYRDVEELLAERGISADHVTLWRWVQRYAPAL